VRCLGILALVVVVALVLVGCGGQAEETPSNSGDRARATTQEEPSGSRPPESTLSYGSQSVTGELGSYCWGPPLGGMCVDKSTPVPPKRETLSVPTGSVAVFDFGGSRQLRSVRAAIHPLEPSKGRLMPPTEHLKVHHEGGRAEMPVDLPAGQYLIDVSIQLVGVEGGASYFFRVAVEGDAGGLPDSGWLCTKSPL
jgi:hypothetical protein